MLTRYSRSGTATAVVSVLAIAALCIGMPSAMADPGDPYSVGGVNQEADNPAVINPDATTQLSIHKYLGADSGVAGDGTEQTITGHDPLQGVQMDVYRVGGIDLTTNAGWTAAEALAGYTVTSTDITAGKITVGGIDYPLVLASSVTTDGTGTATFTQPDGVGLYLVVDNIDASTSIVNVTTGDTINKLLVTGAAPYFVTLPMTNPDDTSRWMYDVNVYPKNQQDSVTKTVEDKGTVTTDGGNVGDHELDFTITSSITDGTVPLGTYAVYDNLNAAFTLTGVSLALSDGTLLVAGTDYEVYTDPSNYRVPGTTVGTLYTSGNTVADGPVVSILMTATGLAKLEADRTLQVVTTITVLMGVQDADGVIENRALFIPSQSWFDQHLPVGESAGVPTDEVLTKYGNVVITKQDPADNTADMSGAEFAIYADPTPGDGSCTEDDVSGTPIATGTITTDNQLTFTGLQTSNWYDGADVPNQADWLSYCLVETQAPTGYNLDATPHYVTIDWTTETATAPAFASELINNEKTNIGNLLPLTGGKGLLVLSIVGAVLLVGGAASYYASARKRRSEEDATAAH